jgi:hypothetical protein
MRALYNAKIVNGKIEVYVGGPCASGAFQPPDKKDWKLPPVKSVVKLKPLEHSMEVVLKKAPLLLGSCKRYVNGTLHVIGIQTAHNLFHTST